jgi:hypothetical protein
MIKWNADEGYLQYKVALSDLMKRLGLGAVDYHVRPELAPYITKILEFVDKKLVLLGDDADILEKLNTIFELFDYGADLIVALQADTLATEVGVYDEEIPTEEETLDDQDDTEEEESNEEEGDYIIYSRDRFIFSWTNVMSCLVTRLKLMYAGLLVEPVSQGCACCCGSTGETYKDWEAWSSGIYPQDEEYDINDYQLGTTQNYGISKGSQCTCGYRL